MGFPVAAARDARLVVFLTAGIPVCTQLQRAVAEESKDGDSVAPDQVDVAADLPLFVWGESSEGLVMWLL